jgi:hypothetical protein
MSLFLAKLKRVVKGKEYVYWTLRQNVWTKGKGLKQRYIASLGRSRSISTERAKEIAKKIGCSLEELKAVNGLKVVDDITKSEKRRS